MLYQTFAAPPPLAPYIRFFWVYEGNASSSEPYIFRGYADCCPELIFHYRSPFDSLSDCGRRESTPAAVLHAQTDAYNRWIVNSDWSIFGCYLYPYAIPALFGIPASEISGLVVDLENLLGAEGKQLEEQVCTARDSSRRIAILTNFFEARLGQVSPRMPLIAYSVDRIMMSSGALSVRQLAKEYGYSERHFERRFKEYAGFNPKLLSRLARFHVALGEYGSAKSLTDIAQDCGYYDQSHFISDFKKFSGYSPKQYFSGLAEGTEYLDAPAA